MPAGGVHVVGRPDASVLAMRPPQNTKHRPVRCGQGPYRSGM